MGRQIPTLLSSEEEWSLYIKNSSNEELSDMYIALKKRRVQLVTEEISRSKDEDRLPRWKYEKFDIPTKSHVPMLLGDTK